MTVRDLKQLLEGCDDDMKVLIPLNPADGFDGMFFSPCIEESGVGEMGTEDLEEDDLKEMELLDKEIPQEPTFVLVPCGFFEKHEGVPAELN